MSILSRTLETLGVIGKAKHDNLDVPLSGGFHFWKELPASVVERMVETSEAAQSEVLAEHISYPIQLYYDFEEGEKERFVTVTLSGIWKKGDVYTYRGQCSEDDMTYHFMSLCIAKMLVGRQEEEIHDHRSFCQRFAFSVQPECARALVPLHIILYLALSDGRLCEDEKKVVERFITQHVHHPLYARQMLDYASHCHVAYPIFREGIQTLKSEYDDRELDSVVGCLKDMIACDREITPKEKEYLTHLGDQLGVWV